MGNTAGYLVFDIETVPDTRVWKRPIVPMPGAPSAPSAPTIKPTIKRRDALENRRDALDAVGQVPGVEVEEAHRNHRAASNHLEASSEARGSKQPFPPSYAHRIIVIGCMRLDERYRLRQFGVLSEVGALSEDSEDSEKNSERQILEEFSALIDEHTPALVTYNGRGFDLPVIAMRSLHHGISMPWYYRERDLRHRYREEGHIDLCDWLADHGATRSGSLDALARLIGLPGKLGVDGSQIEGLYNNGELSRIESYCLGDVLQTALLFLRFRLLQGVLSRDEYDDAVRDMTTSLRRDPRVRELLHAVDKLLFAAGAGRELGADIPGETASKTSGNSASSTTSSTTSNLRIGRAPGPLAP